MLSLCNASEDVFAVPQNALTPNDIYQMSLRGENVDMSSLAYVPPEEGKELDEVPLANTRHVDIVDLWNKQEEVKEKKLRIKKDSEEKHFEINRD